MMRKCGSALLALSLTLAIAGPAVAGTAQSELAGSYDGGQMEMAAGLELGADGRFRYALSYGALDEQAAGTWTAGKGEVLLTSDPVTPPRFAVAPGRTWSAPRLSVALDVPQGMSRQYFDATIAMADGRTVKRQLGEQGLTIKLGPRERPFSVTMELQMFGVRSDPLILPRGRGGEAHFRFEPNDLGKVAFDRTPLRLEDGVLAFERYGRTIRFRREHAGK